MVAAVAVQRGPSSEASPDLTDLLKGFGPGPFLEGLLANLEENFTTPLAFGAHDLHAPLVLDAGVVCARRTEMVAIEVRQAVVVVFGKLGKLPMPEATPTS